MYNACEIDMNAIYVCFQNKKILGEVCEAPYIPLENADEPVCQRPSPLNV